MPKVGPSHNPDPINHGSKNKKPVRQESRPTFFNPHVKAKSLKGRVSADKSGPQMVTALFKKIKSS